MNYRNEWLSSALFNTYDGETISVKFCNGQRATYTARMKEELKKERVVVEIVSLDTGEIYFERDLDGTITINC